MAIKNYYVVLGVHREESETGIRAAYKALAKKLHPDLIGEHGTKAFQEILEAYQTLADPEKRRLHDHLLDHQQDHAQTEVGQKINIRREVEREPVGWEQVPTHGQNFRYAWSPFVGLQERFPINLTGAGLFASEKSEGLNFEVLLTADEAKWGGVISVKVPALSICSDCRGSGRAWMYPCMDCRGLGILETQRTVNVRFPPKVRSGTVIQAPTFVTENSYLRLYLLIDR